MDTIATNILNLTDARYFAARGITWLHYVVARPQDIVQINAIIGWIEGPKTLISFDKELDDLDCQEAIQKIQPDGLLDFVSTQAFTGSIFTTIHDLDQLDKTSDYYLLQTDSVDLSHWLDSEKVFIPVELIQPADLATISKSAIHGLILEGSPEDDVGLKSFEALDEWLDHLDELAHQ